MPITPALSALRSSVKILALAVVLHISTGAPLCAQTPAITTVAGATAPVTLTAPRRSAFDQNGNLYVCDSNYVLRVRSDGATSVFAGNGTPGYSGDNGPATSAQLNGPTGVAVGPDGNVYIADQNNHRIRKIDIFTNQITTYAGNGVAAFAGDEGNARDASLNRPADIAFDYLGNLYVADFSNNRIRLVTLDGIIFTMAGDGTRADTGDGMDAMSASINRPYAITVAADLTVFFSTYGRIVRRITMDGLIQTVAGNGGLWPDSWNGAPSDPLSVPLDMVNDIEAAGPYVYIVSEMNYRIGRIRQDGSEPLISVAGNGSSTVSGDGALATAAGIGSVYGLAVRDNRIYMSDPTRIRRFQDGGQIEAFAGTSGPVYSGDGGLATEAVLRNPGKVAFDNAGNMYIPDRDNRVIRRVDVNTKVITLAAGIPGQVGPPAANNLPATSAAMTINAIAADSDGYIYVAEANNRVWRFQPGGNLTAVAGTGASSTNAFDANGDGGPALNATFWSINDITVTNTGEICVADGGNNRIRCFTVGGNIRTVAGNGSQGDPGALFYPRGLAAQRNAELMVATNAILAGGGAVRQITPAIADLAITSTTSWSPAVSDAGTVIYTDADVVKQVGGGTIAGTGTRGLSGDGGPATSAQLAGPQGVAFDSACHIYISDSGNNRIRRVGNLVAVTIATSVSGPTFTVDGTPYTGPRTFYWESGTSHSLDAGAVQTSGSTRYVFAAWSHTPQRTSTLIVPGCVTSKSYVAEFTTQHHLTLSASPDGTGTLSGSPSAADGFYGENTIVSLTPAPAAGYVLSRYSGATLHSADPASVLMDGPKSVTAVFLRTQTITFDALPDRTFGDPQFSVTASASSGLPVTFAANGDCAVAGSAVLISAAGNCTITASQEGDAVYAAAPPVSRTFSIAKGSQTIEFAPLADRSVTGGPFTVTATSTSALSVSFSATGTCSVSGTTVTMTAPGTCTLTASQGGNANWNPAAPVVRTFTITKADQTITFSAPPDKTFGDPAFTIAATANSGLDVSFAASGNCSVSLNTVTINGAGSCTITASQAGNAIYNAAPSVQHTFTIAKASQTINFSSLTSKVWGDPSFEVSANSSSGLAVTIVAAGACSIGSNLVTITGVGTCTLTASQAGNANYSPAVDVVQTVAVAKATQSINFPALTARNYGDAPFPVTATATSNLPVSFAAGGPCTVAGDAVTITGAGTCTITASQTGDGHYEPAAQVIRSFSISKAAQTITFVLSATKSFGDAPFDIAASASSGLRVSYSAAGSCIVNGSTVTIAGAGNCTITASQEGDANYEAAAPVAQGFVVAKGTQTIEFAPLNTRVFGAEPFPVSATATSGLPVSFAAAGNCTVSGGLVTITGAGSCTITASQSGDVNQNPATVEQSFIIQKAAQTIQFDPIGSKNVADPPFAVSATATSALPVTFSAAGACSISANIVTLTGSGECSITAVQAGDANFGPAPHVVRTFAVGKLTQTITFGALPARTYGDAPFTMTAAASSDLPLVFTAAGPCTVAENTVAIAAAGTCVVTASQPGNAVYLAAAASQSFEIARASQTVAFVGLPTQLRVGSSSISATSTSGLPVTLSVVSGPGTFQGSQLTVTESGAIRLRASQDGNANYLPALPIDVTLPIRQTTQWIQLASIPDQTFGARPFAIFASSSAGLPVTLSVASGPATLDGNVLSLSGVGTVVIRATQDGDSAHGPAEPVEVSFRVLPAVPRMVWPEPAPIVFGTPLGEGQLNASSTVAGVFTYAPGPGALLAPGRHTLTATFTPGDQRYQAASVSSAIVVLKAPQTIEFAPVRDRTVGDSAFPVMATASSGLPVAFRVVSGPASLQDGTITISGPGEVRIAASQAGDANFAAADEVSLTFNVAERTARPTLTLLSNPSYGGTVTSSQLAPDGSADPGAMIELRAAAAPGFEFAGFEGDLTGASPVQSIAMSGNRTVTARFRPAAPVSGASRVVAVGSNQPAPPANFAALPAGSSLEGVTVVSGPSWLAVTPVAGETPLLRLAINESVAAQLKPGAYPIQIKVPGSNGADFTMTLVVLVNAPKVAAVVNSASYTGGSAAGGALCSVFGWTLADAVEHAAGELQQTLAGTSATFTDSTGAKHQVLMQYASSGQVNLLLPEGIAPGEGTVELSNRFGVVSTAQIVVGAVAPGLFSADASGSGVAAGEVISVAPDGTQTSRALASCENGRCSAIPVAGPDASRRFLVLYGTGFRGRSSLDAVEVRIGETILKAAYAGRQSQFAGLDQLNVELPSSFDLKGEFDVTIAVDGVTSNPVRVAF